jgi:exopolysaccharide biosynthesis protein
MTCLRRPVSFLSLVSCVNIVRTKHIVLLIFTIFNGLFPTFIPQNFFTDGVTALPDQQATCIRSGAPSTKVADGVILSTEVLQMAEGSERVSLLDIYLANPAVHLGIVLAHDRLISPDETVSSMANHSGALAGINGDFYEINGPGRPIGMLMINGRLLQSPTVFAVLGVTSEQRLTFGFESFSGSVIRGTASHSLKAINHFVEINEGKLVLLTPDLGAPVSLNGDTIALLQPIIGTSGAFRVVSIQSNVTWLPALKGQDALASTGEGGSWLTANLHKGDYLRVTTQLSPDPKLVQAIGGGPILIKDGALYHDPYPPAPGEVNVHNPLTAVSVNKNGTHLCFFVFDGRGSDPNKSVGLTHAEAAHYLLAHSAYQAMLFDSGGSSEMVARLPKQHAVSVINWPSDGFERPVANGLFVY